MRGEFFRMRLIGNILWIIFRGLEACIMWIFIGLLYFITIIGIPFGKQAFKMAQLSLLSFGKEVKRDKKGSGSNMVYTRRFNINALSFYFWSNSLYYYNRYSFWITAF